MTYTLCYVPFPQILFLMEKGVGLEFLSFHRRYGKMKPKITQKPKKWHWPWNDRWICERWKYLFKNHFLNVLAAISQLEGPKDFWTSALTQLKMSKSSRSYSNFYESLLLHFRVRHYGYRDFSNKTFTFFQMFTSQVR